MQFIFLAERDYLRPNNGPQARMMRSRSPSPTRRAMSQQQGYLQHQQTHDIGFSDAVADMVDLVKTETSRRGRARAKLRGDEFSLSPVRFRAGYHDSALSPDTPERRTNGGFLPPR